jgi:twitching motility two-component system response regulator PilH
VVDDSKTELYHLSDLLGKRGYAVRTAENGEEAMRRLAEEKPDLILMDVVMPGQNGFQLTRTITRDPRFADVPVIMCTSKNQETDRVWGLRQGAGTTSSSPSMPRNCCPRSRLSMRHDASRPLPPCPSVKP